MFLILTLLLALCASCRAGDADFKAQLSTTVDVRALTSTRYDGAEARPLLVFLHGYCLSDDAQQTLKLESMRNVPAVRNRLGIARRRQQTLVQSGLREAALDRNWIYVAPQSSAHDAARVSCATFRKVHRIRRTDCSDRGSRESSHERVQSLSAARGMEVTP